MNKKWIFKITSTLFLILFIIGSFNLFMDPFWCFDNSHKFNQNQKGTNERQQKSNHIYYTSTKYDSILIGSSRTAYMNRHSFSNMNPFNFSASDMAPKEYVTFLNLAINQSSQNINTIIIGMDFFGYLDYGLFKYDNAPSIVQNTKSNLYRYKVLISFDALNTSFKNIRDFIKDKKDGRYNRDFVKFKNIPENLNDVRKVIKNDAILYGVTRYKFSKNQNFQKTLINLKNKFKEKKFIIYTTPVSLPLYEQMIQTGHFEDYKDWLYTLVNIFGEVHHFMYPNEIAKNYEKYFMDAHHAYPYTNNFIGKTISTNYKYKLKDFGILLNKNNIDDFFINLNKGNN